MRIFRIRAIFMALCLSILIVSLGGCFGRSSPTTTPTTSPPSSPPPTSLTSPTSSASPTTTTSTTAVSTTTTTTPTTIPTLPADAQALLKQASANLQGVKSYQLDRTINAAKWSTVDQSDLSTMKILSEMELDVSGQKMKMDNDATVMQSQAASPVIENSIYVVDGVLYVRGLFPEEPELWSKTAVPQTYMPSQDQARQVINLLLFSPVTLAARETVFSGNQSVLCDVLQGSPDLKTFWALLVEQPGMELPSGSPRGVEYSQFIKEASVKVWLSADSGLPIAADMAIRTLIGPSIMPSLPRDISNVISMRMQFYNYNQAAAIELPEEAKNAEDLRLEQAT